MLSRLLRVVTPLCVVAFTLTAPGQTSPPQVSAGQSGYTLHTGTRIVLTDVTVTDSKGNPIHGLSRSAFHIFDNNREEPLASFEEYSNTSAPGPTLERVAGGTFSNNFLRHPPPAFNVILLDTTTINVVDQMYLNEELAHFVQALPPAEPVAIYGRSNDESTIILQDFTSDHALLLSAIQKAIPHLRQPGAEYASDFSTLRQVGMYLEGLPGRKNVLWFSGGSNLFLRSDPSTLPPGVNLHPMYDELEAGRIAIYPIDARGLTLSTFGGTLIQQHLLMEDVAETTGGRAFFNNNGLGEIASRVLDTDTSFYTLSYSPHNLTFNNKWHKIRVKVDGASYNLSYRHGYYDDAANLNQPDTTGSPKKLLLAHGETKQLSQNRNAPIIFEASVIPTAGSSPAPGTSGSLAPMKTAKHETPYSLHYVVPASSIVPQSVGGQQRAVLGVGAVVINRLGRPVGRIRDQVSLGLDEEKLKANPGGVIAFNIPISLPAGDDFLYVVVWDEATGRVGTIHIPVSVLKQDRQPSVAAR